ncbi:MAG: aspartate aminotransferase family protein [Actinomycetota bacterium]|nr:aspartate aminotransferase family protein [Actinomycetota bacterium]
MRSSVFPRVTGRSLARARRAEGVFIYDEDGKRYIDACGGAIVVGVGHGNEAVIDALARQQHDVAYVHGTQFTTAALEDYADALAQILPLDDARVYAVCGGSEAVETALKLARSYHLARGDESRHKVIARVGSYHGNSLNALDASGRILLRAPYEPWLGRTVRVGTPYEYRCGLDEHPQGCGGVLADELDRAIIEQGPDTVACFIAEPVSGATLGAAVPPGDYWDAVARVCRSHGVLLIADEVMTGFGRTGQWFGCEHWGLEPDIVVAGKGASSGYWPLGFAACSGLVYEAVATTGFIHGFTYSHSPVGAAVGLAVLDQLRTHNLVDASRSKGKRLLALLHEQLGAHPHVGDVRGLGLMAGIELVADRGTKAPFSRGERVTERVVAAAFERGLLLYPSRGCADGVNGDLVMLGPPFVISDAELVETVELLRGAVEGVLGQSI